MKVILLDIEGTTTPVTFVYDVLFPFARKHLESFIEKNFEDSQVQEACKLLKAEHSEDQSSASPPEFSDTAGAVSAYCLWLMDQDRKSTGLKLLQGLIWDQGYKSGELKGVVYPDFVPALNQWKKEDKQIFIYSSGSVHAQKLLFGYSS